MKFFTVFSQCSLLLSLQAMCLAHVQCTHKYVCLFKYDLSSFKSNSCCHLFPGNKPAERGIPGAEPLSLSVSPNMWFCPSVMPEEINVGVSHAVWLWLPIRRPLDGSWVSSYRTDECLAVEVICCGFRELWFHSHVKHNQEQSKIWASNRDQSGNMLLFTATCLSKFSYNFELDCKMSSVLIMFLADVSQ